MRPLEERTLSNKAVWSVWVFFLFKKAFPNERNNRLLVYCLDWKTIDMAQERRGQEVG